MKVRPESAIIALTAAIVGIWLALLSSRGIEPLRFSSYANNALLFLSSLFVIAAALTLFLLARDRPERPFAYLHDMYRSRDLGSVIKERLPFVALTVVFLPAFSAMKSAIPAFTSYSWDHTLIELDRLVHGQDVWIILQPILGYPLVTSVISFLYHLWILKIYVGVVVFAFFVGDRRLRNRYFLTFFMTWAIVGVALAIGLASVGPAFLRPLLNDPTFDRQMAYLNEANMHFPVLVLDVQQALISWYESGSHGLGRGITAMPSMHVALSFLTFLATRQISSVLGWIFAGYLLVIMVGSVHLAYHYASDGYVSILVVSLIWWFTGKLPLGGPVKEDSAP